VVLVGPMGAGKTSIGRRVARLLGRPYVDNDDLLERREGRDARAIARSEGVAALHRCEASVVLEALDGTQPAVIGAAASVVDAASVRARLRGHDVVWLDESPEVLARKARRGGHRRDVGTDPVAFFRRQAARRGPRYREVATIVVRPGGRPKDDVAAEVARRLTSAPSPRPPRTSSGA
jgi:shikimate kinase